MQAERIAGLTMEQAREIAARCVDAIHADDHKVAYFAATGEVEPGLAAAVREWRSTEPHVGGTPTLHQYSDDTLKLAEFAAAVEASTHGGSVR